MTYYSPEGENRYKTSISDYREGIIDRSLLARKPYAVPELSLTDGARLSMGQGHLRGKDATETGQEWTRVLSLAKLRAGLPPRDVSNGHPEASSFLPMPRMQDMLSRKE